MTSISERFLGGVISTTFDAPRFAVGGALFGYLYGRLVDLPALEIAKIWAVWGVAQNALLTLSNQCIDHREGKLFSATVITAFSAYMAIQESTKRGLMESHMLFVIIAIQMVVLGLFMIATLQNN